MMLGKSELRGYQAAARHIETRVGHTNQRVLNCLRLVEQASQSEMPAFEGLVLPLGRKQPTQLLGILLAKDTLDVMLPVCAPAPKSPQSFKPTLTPEAIAGIRTANVLSSVFADTVGVDVRPIVMLANTETDIEPVMDRAGGAERYLEICGETALTIADQLQKPAIATTFSDYFAERSGKIGGFHALQYEAERTVRERMSSDQQYLAKLQNISKLRASKHCLILGRQEHDNELSVRYAAQYTALGDHIRESKELDAVCNYPTPNNSFYNAPDKPVIAVFESRVERRQ